MSKHKHLIIGCGIAALAALQQIRSISADDEVVLVTKENHLPYSLAALPYLLSGKITESDLWLADETYFQKMGASLAKGREVVKVQPEAKYVTYSDGGQETYDNLLIASGSKPVKPHIKGAEDARPRLFHTLGDCRALQRELVGKRDIVIYGGGLVAVELAAALLEAGYRVKLIVRSRILRRYVDEDFSSAVESIFINKGAEIFKGYEIQEARRNKNKIEIALSNGNCLDTDAVVVGLGVRPSTSFLEETGIKIGDGVLVNSRMQSNIENIYAAGDVAEANNFFTGETGLSPILLNAVEQGKIAGANMVGKEVEYKGWIPANILRLFGDTAFFAGISLPTDEHYQVFSEKNKHQLKKLVYDGDSLVGAAFLNVELDPGVVLYLIKEGIDIGAHKEMLFEEPREVSRWLMLETEHRGQQ